MEILELIEKIKEGYYESRKDVEELENIIRRMEEKYKFFHEQAAEISDFIKLADMSYNTIRLLSETLNKTCCMVRETEEILIKLQRILPKTPPKF